MPVDSFNSEYESLQNQWKKCRDAYQGQEALIENGADINAKDIDGNTPCHFCSEYGHRKCLKFLLTKRPYLFANNNDDKSAIDVAINGEILAVSTNTIRLII